MMTTQKQKIVTIGRRENEEQPRKRGNHWRCVHFLIQRSNHRSCDVTSALSSVKLLFCYTDLFVIFFFPDAHIDLVMVWKMTWTDPNDSVCCAFRAAQRRRQWPNWMWSWWMLRRRLSESRPCCRRPSSVCQSTGERETVRSKWLWITTSFTCSVIAFREVHSLVWNMLILHFLLDPPVSPLMPFWIIFLSGSKEKNADDQSQRHSPSRRGARCFP